MISHDRLFHTPETKRRPTTLLPLFSIVDFMDKTQVLLCFLPGKVLLSRNIKVIIDLSLIYVDTLLEDREIEPQKVRHRTCQLVATSSDTSPLAPESSHNTSFWPGHVICKASV